MENQMFFNKAIELTVKGFINGGDYNITATKSLMNDLRQFVRIYESLNETKTERKPRKKRNENVEEVNS